MSSHITPELIHLGIEGPIERGYCKRLVKPDLSRKLQKPMLQPATNEECRRAEAMAIELRGKMYLPLFFMQQISKRFYCRLYSNPNYFSYRTYLMPNCKRFSKSGPRGKMLPLDMAIAVMRGDIAYPKNP